MLKLFVFAVLLQYVCCGCPEGYRFMDNDCVPALVNTITCDGTKMDIKCLPNNRIRILHATYGRYDTTTCPMATHDTFTNCTIEKTDIIKQACDGKQTCEEYPPAIDFEYDPCYNTYKYLTIQYVCEYKHPITICERESERLLCPATEVLRINNALWGRTTDKCPKFPFDLNKNCTLSSVTQSLKQRCDGMNECLIKPTNKFLGAKDPCFATYKYLEVDYDCVSRIQNVKVCDGNQMSFSCPANFTIRVQTAIYGRHEHFVCRKEGNDIFLACSEDKTSDIQQVCNGEQSCNKGVPSTVFAVDPCPNTYKYLDIDYICVPKGSNSTAY